MEAKWISKESKSLKKIPAEIRRKYKAWIAAV